MLEALAPGRPSPRQRPRALLADDSAQDAEVLSLALQRHLQGLELRWTEGGDQLMEQIEDWQPDIVLTDVHMPRFDIFSTLPQIRQRWPLLPVVVVSGLVGDEVAVQLIKAGASDFVAKPGALRLGRVVERELRDVQERRERAALAQRLQHQEDLFQRVLDHLPVGVWVCNEAGEVVYGNPAALGLWGRDAGDALARFGRHQSAGCSPERIEIEATEDQRKVVLSSAMPLHDGSGKLLGRFIVHQDISQLHHTETTLRSLSQRVLEAQEQERRWIAQELHDDIGQAIAAMRFQLSHIVQRTQGQKLGRMVNEVLQSSDQLSARLRQICLGLRPLELDDFGLMAALRSLLASLGASLGRRPSLHGNNPERRYPAAVETAAFRIVQEALHNALRHSGCSRLSVHVHMHAEGLELAVCDDGCGFSVEAATRIETRAQHLGLAGMDERARSVGGALFIGSLPQGGTEVKACFHCPATDPAPPLGEAP